MRISATTFSFCLAFFLSGVSNPLIGALPSPNCSGVTDPAVIGPEFGEPTVVFNESLNSSETGFSQNVWAAQAFVSTTANSGQNALQVDFEEGWSGIEFNSSHTISYQKVGSLKLAVRGSQGRKDRNLRVYLLTEEGKKLGVDVNLENYLVGGLTSDYQVAEIPIEDLLRKNVFSTLGSTMMSVELDKDDYFGGMGIQSEFKDSIFVDDIEFVAKEPIGLVTLFDNHLHAKFHNWLGNAKVEKGGITTNGKAISVDTRYNWGGFTIHSKKPIKEKDFGAITFAIKSHNNFDAFIYLVDEEGRSMGNVKLVQSYVHDGKLSSDWKIAWIPLREIASENQTFHGIGIELGFGDNVEEVPGQSGFFWIDEIKVVEKLKWPLPEFPVGNYNDGYKFGEEWDQESGVCDGSYMLHAARDFSVNGGAGARINSAHNGFVQYSSPGSAKWGGYVIVESLGNAFSTVYTHINPSVKKGVTVKVGDKIGVTSALAQHSPHLHFELWVSPYDESKDLNKLLSGVLPRTPCGGRSAFPEMFVDPAIEWP